MNEDTEDLAEIEDAIDLAVIEDAIVEQGDEPPRKLEDVLHDLNL